MSLILKANDFKVQGGIQKPWVNPLRHRKVSDAQQ